MTEKPWPGSADGSCPECGIIQDGWDMEYHVARTGRHGLEWVAPPGQERLIALTCPQCRTKFRVEDDLPP
jgi:hypothetical protein